jgi:hypothetical protein
MCQISVSLSGGYERPVSWNVAASNQAEIRGLSDLLKGQARNKHTLRF